jgi:hypothetical protein
MNKLQRLGIKAKICGCQHISYSLRKQISRLKGDRRHQGQLTKREFGMQTRSYLLAYGFLRGIPYKQIEERHGIGNPPDARRILEITHEGLYSWQRKELTLERVRAWLDAGDAGK